MRTWAPTLLLATSVFCAGLAHAGDRRPILLTPERVWTGDGAPQRGWAVLVANGRIEAASPGISDRVTNMYPERHRNSASAIHPKAVRNIDAYSRQAIAPSGSRPERTRLMRRRPPDRPSNLRPPR